MNRKSRRAALVAVGAAALLAAALPLANPAGAGPPIPDCETGVVDGMIACALPSGATIEVTMGGGNGGPGGSGGTGGAGGSSNTVPVFTGGYGGLGGAPAVGGAGSKVRVVYTNTTSDYRSVYIQVGSEGAAGVDGAAGLAGADATPGGTPQAGGDGSPGADGQDGQAGTTTAVAFAIATPSQFAIGAGGGKGGGGGQGGAGGQGGQVDGFGMDGLNGANGLPGAAGEVLQEGDVPSDITVTELSNPDFEAPFATVKVTLSSITITGGRDGRAMEVTGTSVGLAGKTAKVYLRMRSWDVYREVDTVTIKSDGTFTWSTKGRYRKGYVIVRSGETTSNRVVIPGLK